eukprot:4387166-Pyramimonas_sp.AAC.2
MTICVLFALNRCPARGPLGPEWGLYHLRSHEVHRIQILLTVHPAARAHFRSLRFAVFDFRFSIFDPVVCPFTARG